VSRLQAVNTQENCRVDSRKAGDRVREYSNSAAMPQRPTAEPLVQAALELSAQVEVLQFGPPVVCIYNPLKYAWRPHQEYLRRFGKSLKRVIFLGMNPGPFGMVQTGIPFGEVSAVRDWLGIKAPVEQPPSLHPKRPILGFDCPRSEVSGQRLWKLIADRFGTAEAFFGEHFVVNYCPLAFVEKSGCNRTPDKLPATERGPLFSACDEHLRRVLEVLRPEWVVGIGAFGAARAQLVCESLRVKVCQVLHPSPASPAANRNWAGMTTARLVSAGIWK
jgi:single-strand selective monofunctional uracil DNA glycosylase